MVPNVVLLRASVRNVRTLRAWFERPTYALSPMRQACQSAEANELTMHSMRHSFASGRIPSHCDVVTVQRMLGHAKATTTLNADSHLWATARDRTRQARAMLMASVLVGTLKTAHLVVDAMDAFVPWGESSCGDGSVR